MASGKADFTVHCSASNTYKYRKPYAKLEGLSAQHMYDGALHCGALRCLQYLLIQKSFGQAGRSLSPAHIFLYDDSQAARTGENLFKGFLQLLNTQEELQIMVLSAAIWPNQ